MAVSVRFLGLPRGTMIVSKKARNESRWRKLTAFSCAEWSVVMEKRIETIEMPVSKITTGFGNPRKITKKKREELKRSLDELGNFGIFVIDENNDIIAGNQRLAIIKDENPDAVVTCKRLIGYTDAEKRAINIKDNTHSGDWDVDLLADWTADLTIDLGLDTLKEKDTKERKIDEMELLPYEKYDYVLIVCRSDIDYDILQDRLGIRDKKVPITQKRSIRARAVWFDKVEDKLFGGKKE